LLASFKNFQADVRDHAGALNRGGGQLRVTFDSAALELRYVASSSDEDPERPYARRWAITLLERARARLRLS
jgi:hypothetical protein